MSARSNDKRLLLTKVALLVILAGTAVVGKRHGAWPIATWPMYSSRIFGPPEGTTSIVELQVTTRDGSRIRLDRYSFFPAGSHDIADKMFDVAFQADDSPRRRIYRRALASMVSRALPGHEVLVIDAWRVVWNVNARAKPPLTRSAPARRLRIGRVVVSAL